MSRPVAFILLDEPDVLLEFTLLFAQLQSAGNPVTVWVRHDSVKAALFCAPSANLRQIDQRFFDNAQVYKWWPGTMASAYQEPINHLVIISKRMDEHVERLLLLFPNVRTTVCVPPSPDATIDVSGAALCEIHALVDSQAYLVDRLKLTEKDKQVPNYVDATAREAARVALKNIGLKPEKLFFVVDLGELFEDDLAARSWVENLVHLNQHTPGVAYLLMHNERTCPTIVADGLIQQGIKAYTLCRQSAGIPLRCGIFSLSAGYIGQWRSEVHLLNQLGSRSAVICSGFASHHNPALTHVLWLGCRLPQNLTRTDSTRHLPNDSLKEHLIAFLIRKESPGYYVDLSPIAGAAVNFLLELIEAERMNTKRISYERQAAEFQNTLDDYLNV